MKKSDLKKIALFKRVFYNQLATSLRRALGVFGDESGSPSNLQVFVKGSPEPLLTYNEHQKMKAQLLEMERLKAEAIRLIRERSRCI